jgi:hypothetical protein
MTEMTNEINDKDIKDLVKKYVNTIDKDEIKRLRERERSQKRREYIRDWERKNKDKRGQRFLSKKEAEVILKYLPVDNETKDLINKLKKVLYGRIQKS